MGYGSNLHLLEWFLMNWKGKMVKRRRIGVGGMDSGHFTGNTHKDMMVTIVRGHSLNTHKLSHFWSFSDILTFQDGGRLVGA